MNAPTLNELRHAIPARDAVDEKMVQVRDLLVGDVVREQEARMLAIENRLHELERTFADRIALINERIEALSAGHTGERRAAFEELSRHIQDLGDRVRGLAR